MDEKMKKVMDSVFETLTDEQKEQAKKCKTAEELMALAGEWGIELPDEALDQVNGGCEYNCPDYDDTRDCFHMTI